MAAGQIKGQMTIFDYLAQLGPGPEKEKKKPWHYKFERYIGQRVVVGNYGETQQKHGTITEIQPYYTIVHTDSHQILVATSLNISPEKSVQEMTGADVAEIFAAYLGMEFKPGRFQDVIDEYEHREKGVTISVGIDTYYGENRKFIAVGLDYAKGGSGAPCDSVEEAKKTMQRMIKSMKEWRRKENARRNSEREDPEPAEEYE